MAYAAVMSLKHYIQHLMNSKINPKLDANISPEFKKDAFGILRELRSLLGHILDDKRKENPSFDLAVIKSLDEQIRKSSWKLEDVLESYALSHSLPQIPLADNKQLQQQIHSLITELKKLKVELARHVDEIDEEDDDDDDDEDDDDDDEDVVWPIPDFGGSKSKMDVSSEVFQKIVKWFFDDSSFSSPKSVTLVGMAGIGKTHFAREIYQHPLITQSFDLRAWARVGQRCEYGQEVLVQIVAQLEHKPRKLYVGEDDEALILLLRKIMDGGRRRCFIVLDDVWNRSLCKQIMRSLQQAGVRRVLLTTRIRKVNQAYGSISCDMPFWDHETSWNLLWQNVFPDDSSFPPRLEKAGKKIAMNCEGLPLLILAVAQLLRGVDKTEEYWNKVSDKKTSIFIDAYESISEILASSYDYLDAHLKACFLYMGVFPQTSEISLWKLINLLTAEDFLEPNPYTEETLGTFIINSVKKLISNSVVISGKLRFTCEIRSCKLHSAYWYVCVKEARKSRFFHVLCKLTDASEDYYESQRRLSVQNNMLFGIKEVRDSMAATSTIRSLLFTGEDQQYPVPICLDQSFLKVMDALAIRLYDFPEQVTKLLLLRYLALTHNGRVPSPVSNLQQLRCLIIRQHHNIKLLRDPHSSFLPEEIWDLRRLKYLWIMGRNLPDPSPETKLPNLKTLHVSARSCTEAVYRSIPNVTKLGIKIELHPHTHSSGETETENESSLRCLEHIKILRGLTSLKCVVVNPQPRSSQLVAPPQHLSNMPKHLMQVSLNGLGYSWEDMRGIGALEHLKVLKLRCCAFQGPKWEAEVGQFQSLEFLLLEDIIDLMEWIVPEGNCFPKLRGLAIRHCFKLKEIPRVVLKLRKLEMVDCSTSAVASALRMQEQTSSLQVVINSSWKH